MIRFFSRTAFATALLVSLNVLVGGLSEAQGIADRVPAEFVVTFTEAPSAENRPLTETPWAEVNRLFDTYGVVRAVPTGRDSSPRSFRVELEDDTRTEAAIRAFDRLPEVDYAEPNYLVRLTFTPDDPLYNQQWNFAKVGAAAAWDEDTAAPRHGGDPDVIIAIVDTGVAFESYVDPNPAFCFTGGDENGFCVPAGAEYAEAPDFGETTFTAGYDFVNDDAHPNDDNGHGTHVASTVAESTDNGIGAAGLAFHSTIMPVKVIARDGLGTTAMIAAGIDFARTGGADVINLSLGTTSNSQILTDAVTDAQAAGIVVVAATGNAAENSIYYPARLADVVAVGATGNTDANALASYSNWGSGIDLVAPGGDGSSSVVQQGFTNLDSDDLPADFTTFGYVGYQGTSMATPHVSAALSLLLAAGVDQDEAAALLHESADDLGDNGYDLETGYGLLDAAEALARVTEDIAPPVTEYAISPTRPSGANGYYKSRPTITLTATDDRAGVAAIYYRWDSDEYRSYSGPFRAPVGRHRLRYYAVDFVGNREYRHEKRIRVDTEPPDLTIEPRFDGRRVDRRRLTVRGRVADDVSGIAGVTVNFVPAEVTDGRFVARITLEPGLNRIVVRARDRAGLVRRRTDEVRSDAALRLAAVARSNGAPTVRRLRKDGTILGSFDAFPPTDRGGYALASGDVDGDGAVELLVAALDHGAPEVRVFSASGRFKRSFLAYDASYRGGISLATCDTNLDGRDEIIVGTTAGQSSHVRVLTDRGRVRYQFLAWPGPSRLGATVACGNVSGGARPEIVVAPAATAAPHVRIFTPSGRVVDQFFAWPTTFRLPMSLAVDDVTGDGLDDVVAAPRVGASHVRIFSGNGQLLRQFFAFDPNFRGGVSFASGDTNGDGIADLFVGSGGAPHVRVFTGRGQLIRQFFAFDQSGRGGVSLRTYADSS